MLLITNFGTKYKEQTANNRGKNREYQILVTKSKPRIGKTANTKPANNEGRL